MLFASLVLVALVSYPADRLRRRSPDSAGALQEATIAVVILAVAGASAADAVRGNPGTAALVMGILLGSVVADRVAARGQRGGVVSKTQAVPRV